MDEIGRRAFRHVDEGRLHQGQPALDHAVAGGALALHFLDRLLDDPVLPAIDQIGQPQRIGRAAVIDALRRKKRGIIDLEEQHLKACLANKPGIGNKITHHLAARHAGQGDEGKHAQQQPAAWKQCHQARPVHVSVYPIAAMSRGRAARPPPRPGHEERRSSPTRSRHRTC